MMSRTLIALLCVLPASAMLRGTGHQMRGKIHSDMRPEVVSQLLSNVEKKWVQGSLMVLRNVTDDATSYGIMETSCLKVSSAIVGGSEGEKDRVVEYMQDVCGSAESKESPTMCTDFAAGVEGAMTDDESFNRDGLDLKPFCKKFWQHTIAAAAQQEKQKLDAEETKREEEEQKRKEEEEKEEEATKKKAADEEAARKAAEEAAKKAAEEEAAAKAKEAEDEAKAAKAVEQNATQTVSQQSQNSTETAPAAPEPEAKTETEAAVEVPQANATSSTPEQPANVSEPVAAPTEEVKNATVTENAPALKQVATESNVSTDASKAAPTQPSKK